MSTTHFEQVSKYPKMQSDAQKRSEGDLKTECLAFKEDEIAMKLDQNYLYYPTFIRHTMRKYP